MDLMDTAVVKGTLADGTEVLAVSVEAGTAPDAWRTLRAAHASTGLWPFLVDPRTPTILDKLPRPVQEKERHRGAAEIFAIAEFFATAETLATTDARGSADKAPFPSPRADQVSSAVRATTIGLVPAEYGGVEVPGLLDWDGALGTSGIEHTAVLADWRRRFGAELMTLTGDRIELHVPRPPATPEGIKAVALEQTGYCPGVLFQSGGTLWSFQWE
ncbi:DUF4253 domain-containing protein [Catenulispora sp. NL8]|uniref:DUF4253 domain-containing protein n=1 Tax=Catenulispora pinistramenti TaxID=2705254 RepID=A0ABS5KRQ1_9ACTN|nr:DUF4253 domain-containing protein [Catenulispora pinistramenti]MBS2548721.1 DUF4253 domain-containing protein [Catenulispora pinistramenti]